MNRLFPLFLILLVFGASCTDYNYNDPYSYPRDPYYNPYDRHDRDYDRRYDRDRKERERLERERDRLEDERRRLERERERERDSYRPPPPPPPPPAPKREVCPSGFSPSEQKCSPEERKRGCKDMRLPGGLGCVRR